MREKIIDKIKKCLALASSDNENERATALRQANKLMEAHSVTMLDIEQSNIDMGQSELERKKWQGPIVASVGKLFGVETYNNRATNQWMFVGAESDRITCVEMVKWLLESIERETKTYKGMGRSFIHSFRVGACHKIAENVREIINERKGKTVTNSQGKEIVLQDYFKTQIEKATEYLASQGVILRKSNARTTIRDDSGYQNGKNYASNLSLNRQIDRAPGRKQLTHG